MPSKMLAMLISIGGPRLRCLAASEAALPAEDAAGKEEPSTATAHDDGAAATGLATGPTRGLFALARPSPDFVGVVFGAARFAGEGPGPGVVAAVLDRDGAAVTKVLRRAGSMSSLSSSAAAVPWAAARFCNNSSTFSCHS